MKSYTAAAKAYEADLDRRMNEVMDDWDEDDQCDSDDYEDSLETERRAE